MRIRWDLKNNSNYAKIRITRRKMHWFRSVLPEFTVHKATATTIVATAKNTDGSQMKINVISLLDSGLQ